ncbi:MAG: hypothetical protein AB7K71_06870 [Polyangiaceae bacterium]
MDGRVVDGGVVDGRVVDGGVVDGGVVDGGNDADQGLAGRLRRLHCWAP